MAIYYLGGIAACLTIFYPIFALLHWALFKRVLANRYASNIAAVVAAYGVCIAVMRLDPEYVLLFGTSAIAGLGLAFLRGRKESRTRAALLNATFG